MTAARTTPESPSAQEAARAPRADSLRNRARLLEAAEEVFGSEGIGVPVDRIAERAGVGVGTLYRHFPTKEALFQAIVLRHFERLLDEARTLRDAEDPAAALFALLHSMVATAVSKRDLADALTGAGIDFKAAAGDRKLELDEAITELLQRAQAEGTIRADVTTVDMMSLVMGACTMSGGASDVRAPSPTTMVTVVCDGLRSGAGG